jgi:putative membrane protein
VATDEAGGSMRRPGGSRNLLLHYAQGLLMGSADIIPGVSGGTMALIVGIYERLIASIRGVVNAVLALFRGGTRAAADRLREVEWGLVVPLGAGILTALLVGARFIPGLLERYPVQAHALFFGLIAGSLSIPWRRIGRPTSTHVGMAAAAAIIAFLLVGLPPREIPDPSLLVVFLAASVAICAMILPGVSGSFLLLVMGLYVRTLRAVNDRDLLYIAVFGLGAVVGLGAFSKLLDYLLRRHHDLTMAALVGLMAGSLRALWPFADADRNLHLPPDTGALLVALGFALLGFAIVRVLSHVGSARLHDTPEPEHGRG